MWRRYVRSVAVAEIHLMVELQRRGLTWFLETQKPFRFDFKEDLVHGTIVDCFWNPPFNLAVFLDGEPVHNRRVQSFRDECVDEALRKRGIKVLRFTYKPPIRKSRLKEIVDEIEKTLKEMGYRETVNRRGYSH